MLHFFMELIEFFTPTIKVVYRYKNIGSSHYPDLSFCGSQDRLELTGHYLVKFFNKGLDKRSVHPERRILPNRGGMQVLTRIKYRLAYDISPHPTINST